MRRRTNVQMPRTSNLIRAGFIGLNGFAAVRRRAVRDSRQFQVVGGFDTRPEAMEAAARHEGARFTAATSAQELVERNDIDVVFIASSSESHLNYASAAARAGKHVFVEKP